MVTMTLLQKFRPQSLGFTPNNASDNRSNRLLSLIFT